MLEHDDLSKRVATRPLTPEEITQRDEATARMPEIMAEFAQLNQAMLEKHRGMHQHSGASHIRLRSSMGFSGIETQNGFNITRDATGQIISMRRINSSDFRTTTSQLLPAKKP